MKKKVLLSSILTIALCLTLIAGSTYALFTSQSEVNIAVTSGKVNVVATVEDFKLYSVEANSVGTIIDENGGRYEYADRTAEGTFANGGTAELAGSVITLDKITPGDKITFGVDVANNSDVAIQCRYTIQCITGEDLMKGLVVSINNETYHALKSYTSAWATLEVGASITTEEQNVEFAIELPVTAGNEYQEKEVSINVLVEAVQSNADLGETNVPQVEFLANSNATTVANAAELQAALDNAVVGENFIVITDDIVGNVVATQKAGVKTVIEGNGYTFGGMITVDGKSGTYTTAGLTIKNLNFKADSITGDACIRLGNGTNATRYTCNVTVDNCTFDIPGAVGVKSYTGGDKNVTIINCTATANAHSLAQLKGVDGVLIIGCEVNSKNGINFNNSTNVVVDNCTVDVSGYAVRFGESSGGAGAAEVYTIKNSSLKSANEDGDATIILRGTADYSTLTIKNTEIVATVAEKEIANSATDAVVVID